MSWWDIQYKAYHVTFKKTERVREKEWEKERGESGGKRGRGQGNWGKKDKSGGESRKREGREECVRDEDERWIRTESLKMKKW